MRQSLYVTSVFVENRLEIQLEDKDKGDNWRKGSRQLL